MELFRKILMRRSKFLIGLFLFLPAAVAAYSYSGQKWYQTPWTIKTVDIDPIGRNLSEELAIRSAMSSWSNAGAKFYYIDNTISRNDFGYYSDPNTATLMVNNIEMNWLGYITRTYVRVNTAKPWATNGDPNSYDFQSASTHELGHGLRLNHSSVNGATMQSTMSRGDTSLRSLESDDRSGIKHIYGSF